MGNRFVHGGNVYDEKPADGEWLDFSANINPLGMPGQVRKTIAEHIDGLVHYPDPEARELKQALAQHYGLSAENLVLGNGAAELFYLFMQTVRPGKVLIPVPSFSEYERAAMASGAGIVYFRLEHDKSFRPDIEALAVQAGQELTDAIILGNPNNPTGCLLPSTDILKLLELTEGPKAPWIMVDESFMDFREDAGRYSVRSWLVKEPRLFLVQSMTKFYALPGLRLGYGAGSSALIRRLEQGKDVWNVNLLAQKAGAEAVRAEEYARRSRAFILKEGRWLAEQLASHTEWQITAPTVNFLFLRLPEPCGPELVKTLREQGVLVRDCSNYPGLDRHYLRVAVRSHEENEELLRILQEIGAFR